MIYEKNLHKYTDWEDLQGEIIRKSANAEQEPMTETEENLRDDIDEGFR